MSESEQTLEQEIALSNEVALNKIDSVIAEAVEKIKNGEQFSNFDFDDSFNLTIRVAGESWDERIDVRLASFIVELQKAVSKVQKEVSDYSIKDKDLVRVKIKVNKGSQLATIDVKQLLESILPHMTPLHITITLCFSALVFGSAWAFRGSRTSKDAVKAKELELQAKVEDEKTKRLFIEALRPVERSADQFDAASKKLIRSMDESDTILLPGAKESLTKDQASKIFPRAPKSKKLRSQIDGEYSLLGMKTEELIPKILLSQDDCELQAQMPLQGDGLEKFFSQLKADTETRKHGIFKFQIDVEHNTKGVITAAVIRGIGDPREGSKKLRDIVG